MVADEKEMNALVSLERERSGAVVFAAVADGAAVVLMVA